jgi:hypothetical protein
MMGQNVYERRHEKVHTQHTELKQNTLTQVSTRIRVWKHGTIPIKFQLPYIQHNPLHASTKEHQ